MNAADLLEWAEAEGVRLAVKQKRICWQADHAPPPELLERIKAHKQEIIDAIAQHYRDTLAQAAGVPFDWLAAHYFTADDLANIERGEGKYADPAAFGAWLRRSALPFIDTLH